MHQYSCVETPEQNARVERKHQHILNVARALMMQSAVPKYLWSYAVLHSVFLTVLECLVAFVMLPVIQQAELSLI